ncbi:3-oxoacyl-[acyl-carrier-protein] reductase FabG [Neochlamydia sp. AcF65]|uniref:3-oxoacyl-ACP reductase FabG n=1 Tax=Neochlamydia sp. AcF65 TaxID=2795735 RepID=UPI001BC8D44F|nr:3-oxoacyl-ACP reductase FabG [Neochlamydia sp. AcF65]MBS4164992.1 3-oxoacyl-[acyl-carrier-protein] reductase FabG [Neochlamydia sp. AcF65]
MHHLLNNQVAIITGGTAGIGKAIAREFARQGATVAIFGTNEKRGQEVVQEIGAEKASFYPVNVAKTLEVEAAIKLVQQNYGKVDILVNNAGITRDQLMLKMTEEDWDTVMEVNLKSCYNTCKALTRHMLKARQGVIINISSVIGLIGNSGQANYAASKAAIIGFTKALAKEFASRNIRINCIAPGFIDTQMTEAMTEQQRQAILSSIPMERMGAPEDIASAAVFLASSMAQYITGQVLIVDGGMVM